MLDPKEMPFLMHLKELRERLIKVILVLIVSSGALFVLADTVFAILTRPLLELQHAGKLIGTGPLDAFMVKVHLAILCGFLASLPYTFYQLWAFVAPALKEQERRLAVPFVLCTTLLFLAGAAFCYLAVLPAAFEFFMAEYLSLGVEPTIRIDEYMSFLIRLILVFGIVFEMPMLSYLLSRLGIINSGWLVRQLRMALVAIFVIAGILTPSPDVASQLLLAGPMLVLYGICILIAKLGERGRRSI